MDCAKQCYKYIQGLKIKEAICSPELNNAVNQLNELYQKGFIKEPFYSYTEEHDENGNPIWKCDCKLEELKDTFTVQSPVKKDAKKEAAFKVLQVLFEK